MSLEKRLRALERKLSIESLPPFVVFCENENGVADLLWIGWCDKGPPKSWTPGGNDLPDALKTQMQQYHPDLCPATFAGK